MPYKIKWEAKGLLIRFSETVSSLDIIKSNSEIIGNPKIEDIEYIISDFTNINGVILNESDVEITKNFAVSTNPINPMAKVAIVSSEKELINLIESFLMKLKAEIPHANYNHFAKIKEARKWVIS